MRLPVIDGNDAVTDEEIPALLALYNEHCSTEGGFIAPMDIMAYEEGKDPVPALDAEVVRQSVRSRL